MLDVNLNQENLVVGLNLINKYKDNSRIREETLKIRVARRYNSKVTPKSFQKGDLVWRMRSEAKKNEGMF